MLQLKLKNGYDSDVYDEAMLSSGQNFMFKVSNLHSKGN